MAREVARCAAREKKQDAGQKPALRSRVRQRGSGRRLQEAAAISVCRERRDGCGARPSSAPVGGRPDSDFYVGSSVFGFPARVGRAFMIVPGVIVLVVGVVDGAGSCTGAGCAATGSPAACWPQPAMVMAARSTLALRMAPKYLFSWGIARNLLEWSVYEFHEVGSCPKQHCFCGLAGRLRM